MLTVNVFGTFSHWSLSLNVLYMTNSLSVDYIFDDLLVNSVPDPHLEIRWGEGGSWSSRPWDGGGVPPKKCFSARRVSVWSENKVGPQAPPLDLQLQLTAKVFLLNNWSFAINTTKGTVDYHYTFWMHVLYMWLGTCFTCDLVFFVCLFVSK